MIRLRLNLNTLGFDAISVSIDHHTADRLAVPGPIHNLAPVQDRIDNRTPDCVALGYSGYVWVTNYRERDAWTLAAFKLACRLAARAL